MERIDMPKTCDYCKDTAQNPVSLHYVFNTSTSFSCKHSSKVPLREPICRINLTVYRVFIYMRRNFLIVYAKGI